MSARDGGPAFPRPHSWDESPVTGIHEGDRIEPHSAQDGMTLRDYFAAAALTGYRAGMAHEAQMDPLTKTTPSVRVAVCESVAGWAYRDADAMLAERAK